MELERLAAQLQRAILAALPVPDEAPDEVSVWIRFVRYLGTGPAPAEETIGQVHRLWLSADTWDQLIWRVAEECLLFVFGEEAPLVTGLPNLMIKLIDHKAVIPMEGAPPVDEPGQIFLKVTVRW